MKNKAYIILGLIIIIGSFYIFFTRPTVEQTSQDQTNNNTSTENNIINTSDNTASNLNSNNEIKTPISTQVTYTDNGFIPQSITIKSGNTVTFTNESIQNMWVASNPHQTHTDFSIFDQKQIGDTYSFTFDTPGKYIYHNHMRPNHQGTILVQ